MFNIKMSLFAIFLFFKIFSTNAIICWQCSARSEKECKETGYFQECWAPQNKFVCHTKVTRNQAHLQIIKGCTEAAACIDERKQNWGKLGQCKEGMQSTCRCCCFKDFCNEDSCVRARNESCKALSSPLNNGSVRCSDGNNVGSICRFMCPRRNNGKNITIIPDYGNTITCLPNGKWSSPVPNCRETCGPNVRVDFIVLGQRATAKELLFVIRRSIPHFLKAAKVESGYMHFTSLRYRTRVHQPVFTFVDSITKNNSEIIEFFANLPLIKDDSGPVNTGAALWYVYNNIINKEGDRPDVTNFLMLDTAAVPDDDAITPARALRKAGVVILPRFNPGPETNYQKAKEEMTAIAGYRSNWFLNKNSLEWFLFEQNIYCRLSFPVVV